MEQEDNAVETMTTNKPSEEGNGDAPKKEKKPGNGESDVALSTQSLPAPTKPLKSILKKRKPQESLVVEEDSKVAVIDDIPKKKPNFGGSITEALSKIKHVTPSLAKVKRENNEPEPSAFIREMEKQNVRTLQMPESLKVSSDAQDMDGNSIVLITNLPFKVTKRTLVTLLGIWPKNGYEGVHLVTESNGKPAGHAYIVLEKHTDMMEVVRMTGLALEGRKIKAVMGSCKDLKNDLMITETAKKMMELSRVVRVAQLPFQLKKNELPSILDCVSFTENDIYWKPLMNHQENSGRGYIVLSSNKEVKKLANKEFVARGRHLEVSQVHPEEIRRFCRQCSLPLHHELTDPFPETFMKNLKKKLDHTYPYKESTNNDCKVDELSNIAVPAGSNGSNNRPSSSKSNCSQGGAGPPKHKFHRVEEKKRNIQNQRLKQALREINERPWEPRRPPPPGPHPCRLPFRPTVFLRMYNVPEKTTTLDIRNFFAPVLPAKIAQNIGYDIYDIEFYNPDDAWISLRKNLLLIRKNPIHLEMLPGPPHPLPPRPLSPGPSNVPPPHMGPRPMPPHLRHPPPGTYPVHGINMRPMHPGPTGPVPMRPIVRPPPGGMPPHPMPYDRMPRPVVREQPPTMPPPMPSRDSAGPFPPPRMRHGSPERRGPPMIGNRPPHVINHPPRHEPLCKGNPLTPGFHQDPNSRGEQKPSRPGNKPVRDQDKSEMVIKTEVEVKKETIPVPPLPKNFEEYEVPPFNPNIPVGQAVITPIQGFFCQLCSKFYSSKSSAEFVHCKSKGHYDKLKQLYYEKKKLRKLAGSSL